jgi:phosphoesterase RecJ-like protein
MQIETRSIDAAAFVELIRNVKTIALTTHVNPDGDALGSEIGLAEWLISIGKTVSVVNHSPTPYNYFFLDTGTPIIEQYDVAKHDALLKLVDLLLVLDVNDPGRIRSIGPYALADKSKVAVIDHHLEPQDFAREYFIDTEACSTGELIYQLVTAAIPMLGGAITPKGANALYVAIMTDTGSFKFPRTDSGVFRMCADLLDLGADPVASYNEVYNSAPAARLLLMRECLNSLEYQFENRMAFQSITQSQLRSIGANEEDVDGFVQMPFQVGGIVLSAFLLELKEGWKLSVRSKGDVSAAALAQAFGGNGHFNAAGARIAEALPFGDVKAQIIAKAGSILQSAPVAA